MNEYVLKKIALVAQVAALLVCVALVIVGQRSIGYPGLFMMLAGLAGILVLLYLYNRRYR